MCRLYALMANEPTRAECSLVRSQNSLMRQSEGDAEGVVHGHGWGVADYTDGGPVVEKQAWAAYHGEHFPTRAARVHARAVIAHVRRATVGQTSIENTHPFRHGRFTFAHNGTIPEFEQVRQRMLAETDPLHRAAIRGQTDSEHLFHYLLTRWSRGPQNDLPGTVRAGLERVLAWCHEIAPGNKVGLNIVLSDGRQMVASRLNRSLWYLCRDAIVRCPVCERPHVHHEPGAAYRAVEVASEPVTPDEPWRLLPDASVLGVDPEYRLRIESLRVPAQSTPRSADPGPLPTLPVYPAALWADALA
jgi:glutamine amidotransferase